MVLVVLILMPGTKQQLIDRSVASIVEVYDVTLEWRVDWTYMGTILLFIPNARNFAESVSV